MACSFTKWNEINNQLSQIWLIKSPVAYLLQTHKHAHLASSPYQQLTAPSDLPTRQRHVPIKRLSQMLPTMRTTRPNQRRDLGHNCCMGCGESVHGLLCGANWNKRDSSLNVPNDLSFPKWRSMPMQWFAPSASTNTSLLYLILHPPLWLVLQWSWKLLPLTVMPTMLPLPVLSGRRGGIIIVNAPEEKNLYKCFTHHS